jgi:hypothetical protein
MVGQDQALSTERGYAARVLPAAVLRELAAAVGSRGGDRARHLLGASAVVVGLGATALGYARGRLGSARAAAPAPRLTLQEPVGATRG